MRYKGLRVVIDHCMKPQIGAHDPQQFRPGAEGMARLAGETSACVKLSGLITEDGPDWSVETLAPYVARVISAFGAERIMWGSDWPVCRLRGEYSAWRGAAKALTSGLGGAARGRIFGETAAEFYGLKV